MKQDQLNWLYLALAVAVGSVLALLALLAVFAFFTLGGL